MLKIAHKNTEGINRQEFEAIFDQYYDKLKNFLFYRCGNTELAEDIVQDVFIKLWEYREKVKKDTVQSLLYSIANNLFNNDFNRKKVRLNFVNTIIEDNRNNESPEYLAELKEFDVYLQNTLNDMPEKSRTVFLMNRIDEMTYKDIASSLDISVKAVEKRMSKALAYFSDKIGKKV